MTVHTKAPCDDCPFRVAPRFRFSEGRAREIATALRQGASFSCHKSLDYSADDKGKATPRTKHCAGAMLVLENEGCPNQLMQIAERLGYYDPERLQVASQDVPVYEDLEAFVRVTSPPAEASDRDRVPGNEEVVGVCNMQ